MARAEDEPYHRSFLSGVYTPIDQPDQYVDAEAEGLLNSDYPLQGNVYRPGSPPGLPDFIKRKSLGSPSFSPPTSKALELWRSARMAQQPAPPPVQANPDMSVVARQVVRPKPRVR